MPKIVDKAAKRAEIAKHAMALFAKAGFENTPIREITSQAGMGKGTFYDYFTDKTDILNEIVRIIFTEWMEFMISKISRIDDPLEQLRALTEVTGVAAAEVAEPVGPPVTEAKSVDKLAAWLLAQTDLTDLNGGE